VQTLLEQMKGVFEKTQGMPLDKIPPTVGLNVGRMGIANCKVIHLCGGVVLCRAYGAECVVCAWLRI
jgi:hypothetical protein